MAVDEEELASRTTASEQVPVSRERAAGVRPEHGTAVRRALGPRQRRRRGRKGGQLRCSVGGGER